MAKKTTAKAKAGKDDVYRVMPANTTHKPSVKTVGAPKAEAPAKPKKAKAKK